MVFPSRLCLQLMKSILTVSGKDMSHFMEQWLCRCGIPSFVASFTYVRKKNLVELKLKQDLPRNLAKFNVSDVSVLSIVGVPVLPTIKENLAINSSLMFISK